MKKLLSFPVLLAVLAIVSSGLLSGCVASAPAAAVVVRPRPYYRPAPVVVVPPRPVVVVPRRAVIVKPAPRPYYPYRPHRFSGRLR
ncbi:hypothetical protein [Hymenobacter aerophilus]|uniref:hypothetical protein n=1 Tax=Hymenobacter aerophilus TaxID=119644 RepID=UPI00036EAAA5|nr:hypothetical protein [Hymenobacter aerophilus]